MNYYKTLHAGGKSSSSKIKLILTAEREFSKYGIEGVSLREVASRAGSSNNNAVQYHFGNKHGLLKAIYAYRLGELEDVRQEMLDRAEAEGCLDPGVLLRIMCLPQLRLVSEDGTNHYASFMAQFASRYWHTEDDVEWGDPRQVSPCLELVVRMLVERLQFGSEQLAISRIVLCNEMFLHALVRWDNVERRSATYRFSTMIGRTLEAVEAAYLAPPVAMEDDQKVLGEFAMRG